MALPSAQEKRLPRILNSDLSAAAAAAEISNTAPMTYPLGALGNQQNGVGDTGEVSPDSARPLMELSYDKLVYAVGTKTGTFGVPGVREHCYMLKV